MATALERRIFLGVTAGAFGFATLVALAFVYVFARSVSLVSLAAGVIWLVLLIVGVWYLFVGRMESTRLGKYSAKNGLRVNSGAPLWGAIFALISGLTLLFAYSQGAQSQIMRFHWIIQIVLVSIFAALLVKKLVSYRAKPALDTNYAVLENVQKRNSALERIGAIEATTWLKGFEPKKPRWAESGDG